jgi:hypothetical protein
MQMIIDEKKKKEKKSKTMMMGEIVAYHQVPWNLLLTHDSSGCFFFLDHTIPMKHNTPSDPFRRPLFSVRWKLMTLFVDYLGTSSLKTYAHVCSPCRSLTLGPLPL